MPSGHSRCTRSRALALAVALALILPVVAPTARPPVLAVGPSPSASPAPTDLTGHWAVAGTSGFDLRQDGRRITGTSVAGVRFSGSFDGRDASFRFWSGSSYAKADPQDRGTGTFRATPDGTRVATPAERRYDAVLFTTLLYWFRDWDRDHGVGRPR